MTQQQSTELDKLIASIKELRESTSELRESQVETDKQMKETDKKFQKTEKMVSHLVKDLEGTKKSIGKETEEFFLTSLQAKPYLGTVEFDFVDNNRKRRKDGEEIEIDIFMENGKSVGIVEVKNKVSKKHLKELERDMKRFTTFYPLFKEHTIYGALAGKIIPEEVVDLAKKNGIFLLKQQGNHMEVVTPK